MNERVGVALLSVVILSALLRSEDAGEAIRRVMAVQHGFGEEDARDAPHGERFR